MLDTKLIEKALALTGKTMEDMEIVVIDGDSTAPEYIHNRFSIEKFCYYLLSPEFTEKYMPLIFPFEITGDYEGYLKHTSKDFGEAIYEYQLGNEEPLSNLLSKI